MTESDEAMDVVDPDVIEKRASRPTYTGEAIIGKTECFAQLWQWQPGDDSRIERMINAFAEITAAPQPLQQSVCQIPPSMTWRQPEMSRAPHSTAVHAHSDENLRCLQRAARTANSNVLTPTWLPLAQSSSLLMPQAAWSNVTIPAGTEGDLYAIVESSVISHSSLLSAETVSRADKAQIEQLFPQYSEAQLKKGRKAVEADLRLHKAYDEQQRAVSVWQKLSQCGLQPRQLEILLNAAACLRENFARQRGADRRIDPDQKSNWLHTMDELDEILESTRGAAPEDILRASMAMFGDAVKTKRNFMVHNLDGHQAWLVVAKRIRHEFSDSETHGIGEANKEHQISPPELMARVYTRSIISSINNERGKMLQSLSTKTFSAMTPDERKLLLFLAALKQSFDERAEQLAALQSQGANVSESQNLQMQALSGRQLNGAFVTEQEARAISGIYAKMCRPFASELGDTPGGGKSVMFDEKEAELFRLTGNEFWHVPHASTPWYEQSRLGIDADSKANYARIGGFRKLLHLNGPESDVLFQFPTLDACLQSPRRSYAEAWEVMTPAGQIQASARLFQTDEAIERAKQETERWLREELGLSVDSPMPVIPFWNADLFYPNRGEFDCEWWRINRIPVAERSAGERAFWRQHRFDGLTDTHKRDYELAIRIRDFMVDQLGREQRVDGSVPQDFLPVME